MLIKPPWPLGLSFRIRCPVCKGRIAGWVVKDRFQCPNCDRMLRSNRSQAMKWALGSGGALYLSSMLLLNLFGDGSLEYLVVALIIWATPI